MDESSCDPFAGRSYLSAVLIDSHLPCLRVGRHRILSFGMRRPLHGIAPGATVSWYSCENLSHCLVCGDFRVPPPAGFRFFRTPHRKQGRHALHGPSARRGIHLDSGGSNHVAAVVRKRRREAHLTLGSSP